MSASRLEIPIVKHIHRPIGIAFRREVYLCALSAISIQKQSRVRHVPGASKRILDVSPICTSRQILNLDLVFCLPRRTERRRRRRSTGSSTTIPAIVRFLRPVPIRTHRAVHSSVSSARFGVVVPAAASSVASVASTSPILPRPATDFHPQTPTVEIVPISPSHRVLRVSRILERHERERRRSRRGLNLNPLHVPETME